ncbi:MAG: TIGR03545 family protein [Helicobacteraceae bacterium]|nr:TIGR03545 family protein [Helicobacteraceae bacterium]
MFNFIRKLFKALNSSAKSWQLSGAIVLAMFAGFLPTSSLILLDILFLALILNINFGLFLLFTAIFSAIGYLFDPMFDSLGYSVLTNDALQGFFTSLYNSALFRWSSFNYTLVTGSLIVSTILALPLLLILNKVITLYRDQIGAKLNEWRATRWMKLFNEEAKTSSLFRWWGVGVFGALLAGIALVFILLFDPLARLALEKSLAYSLQTQVDIKDLDSSFSDLRIKISGIEIADKKNLSHNLVQIGDMEFDLSFSALLEKKAMIEMLNIDALAFNEKRETMAKPYDDSPAPTNETKQAEASDVDTHSTSQGANPFTLPDVNAILAKEELKSVTEAQKLKADIEKTKEKWSKISDELKNKNEIDEIKADAKKLQQSLKGADITKIASAKSDIDKLKAKISSLKEKYASLQKDFNADQKRLQKQINTLKNLPQQDINRLKQKYSLNASGGANLIGTLTSDAIGEYMHMGLKYYEMLAPYIRSDAKQEELQDAPPPRGEGRWIKYANLSNVPDLVIKKAKINVKLKNDVFDIDVTDLSSNQKLYKKPMIVHADAKGVQYAHIVADVVDDRRSEKAKTSFDIKVTKFKTANIDMKTLSMNDIVTTSTLKGAVEDGSIHAKSKVNVSNVKLEMPSQKLINDLLSDISKFNVDIAINGALQQPSIVVKSDLDQQLSKGLNSMIAKKTAGFEKELKAGILKKAGASTKGLSADLGDVDSLLDSKQDTLSGINTNFSPSSSGGLKLPMKLF